MDAEALREFDELAAETGRALYGAWVKIGERRVRANCPEPRLEFELVEGASLASGELVLWVPKRLHEDRPAVDAVVEAHGRLWIVRTVTGDGCGEAEWCVRAEPKN